MGATPERHGDWGRDDVIYVAVYDGDCAWREWSSRGGRIALRGGFSQIPKMQRGGLGHGGVPSDRFRGCSESVNSGGFGPHGPF